MNWSTCVSVAETAPEPMLSSLKLSLESSEYTELRLDYLDKGGVAALLESAKPYLDRTVCTLRPDREGGRFAGTEAERVGLLEEISGYRPYLLDVELATFQANPGLRDRLDADILVSWHDFERTPAFSSLRRRLSLMKRYSKNVKMAVMAHDARDVAAILGLYAFRGDAALVAFAMGEIGRFSRICSLYLGCPLTYVSLGEPVAPGQYSLAEVRRIASLGVGA